MPLRGTYPVKGRNPVDERHLPGQREKHYADQRHLPRQREEHYADEWHLPNQTMEDC